MRERESKRRRKWSFGSRFSGNSLFSSVFALPNAVILSFDVYLGFVDFEFRFCGGTCVWSEIVISVGVECCWYLSKWDGRLLYSSWICSAFSVVILLWCWIWACDLVCCMKFWILRLTFSQLLSLPPFFFFFF